jgi:hypothetical protein
MTYSERNERSNFEHWARAEGFSLERMRDDPGVYDEHPTDAAWRAWQARAKAAAR